MLYKCSNCQNIIDSEYITLGQLNHFITCITGNFSYPYKKLNSILVPFDGEEMPKATLSYEALQIDTEGNVTEGAYKLKLEGNFKSDIEPMVTFVKAAIPSSDRTYDPTTREWFYHEKFHPTMEQALKGSRFVLNYTVTKEQFVELKRKKDEFARQAGQTFQVKQYDTNEDLAKFGILLTEAAIPTKDYVSWSREIATSFWKKALKFFHPDLHPERTEQASELNEVWSRLKEGYYIK